MSSFPMMHPISFTKLENYHARMRYAKMRNSSDGGMTQKNDHEECLTRFLPCH